MSVRSQFNDDELAAIQAATQQAERKTGGELVCVIVDRCDSYQSPVWQALALGSLGGTVVAGIAAWYSATWSPLTSVWMLAPPFLGATLALLAIWLIRPLALWLVPPDLVRRRVDRRAAAAFLEEEIFDTRDRTGVLLFVALYEHQIRILTDRGVEEKVGETLWQPILENLTAGLRSGDRAVAIADAIRQCGQVLVDHGVSRRVDDENELSDEPRFRDE